MLLFGDVQQKQNKQHRRRTSIVGAAMSPLVFYLKALLWTLKVPGLQPSYSVTTSDHRKRRARSLGWMSLKGRTPTRKNKQTNKQTNKHTNTNKQNKLACHEKKLVAHQFLFDSFTRSSSREVRITVPIFFCLFLGGNPPPRKETVKRAPSWGTYLKQPPHPSLGVHSTNLDRSPDGSARSASWHAH